jgi:hypothetical protein
MERKVEPMMLLMMKKKVTIKLKIQGQATEVWEYVSHQQQNSVENDKEYQLVPSHLQCQQLEDLCAEN